MSYTCTPVRSAAARSATRAGPSPERGSALLLVMVVMLLLMTLALPLIFVTRLEMQLGGRSRVITNNFYAAESGIHAAIGGLMVTQDWSGEAFALIEGSTAANQMIGHRVVTTRVQGMGSPQDPPLTIANEGENTFHTFSIVLTSIAERVSWPDPDPENPTPPIYEDGDPRESEVTVQAKSSQTALYFLSPIKTPASIDDVYNEDAARTIAW